SSRFDPRTTTKPVVGLSHTALQRVWWRTVLQSQSHVRIASTADHASWPEHMRPKAAANYLGLSKAFLDQARVSRARSHRPGHQGVSMTRGTSTIFGGSHMYGFSSRRTAQIIRPKANHWLAAQRLAASRQQSQSQNQQNLGQQNQGANPSQQAESQQPKSP